MKFEETFFGIKNKLFDLKCKLIVKYHMIINKLFVKNTNL
jgi:hypothetical protein